jgi:hypothetical protein
MFESLKAYVQNDDSSYIAYENNHDFYDGFWRMFPYDTYFLQNSTKKKDQYESDRIRQYITAMSCYGIADKQLLINLKTQELNVYKNSKDNHDSSRIFDLQNDIIHIVDMVYCAYTYRAQGMIRAKRENWSDYYDGVRRCIDRYLMIAFGVDNKDAHCICGNSEPKDMDKRAEDFRLKGDDWKQFVMNNKDVLYEVFRFYVDKLLTPWF